MSTAVLHHQPAHQEPAPPRGPRSGQGRRGEPAKAQPARPGQLLAAAAQALFTSDLSAQCEHTQAEVAAAIRHALRTRDGIGGCAAEVAAAYGEHPETAARRMRWARAVIPGIDDIGAALAGGAAGPAGCRPGKTGHRPRVPGTPPQAPWSCSCHFPGLASEGAG